MFVVFNAVCRLGKVIAPPSIVAALEGNFFPPLEDAGEAPFPLRACAFALPGPVRIFRAVLPPGRTTVYPVDPGAGAGAIEYGAWGAG